ncbi:MAG: hypothetical protein U0228_18845 [Myxococcaceae bacterium]
MLRRALLTAVVFAASGCFSPVEDDSDLVPRAPDAGTDAGVRRDGGQREGVGAGDAGDDDDAGAPVDSGIGFDAGVIAVDAGGVDAGVIIDAGMVMVDAGVGPDAGVIIDAGVVMVDAGVGSDAGVRYWTLGSGAHFNPRAIVFQGSVRVFAYQSATGDLAWCDGAPGCTWQVLDGAGGSAGRVQGDVGGGCIAASVWGNELYVYYPQSDFNGSHRVLRVAVLANGAWTFQTIDGQGSGTHGVTSGNVGGCPSASTAPPWTFVGFTDLDNDVFRLGWTNRQSWDFQTLDGQGGPNGRINAPITPWLAQVTVGGVLHTFYGPTGGGLRQGTFTGVGDWTFRDVAPSTPLVAAPFTAVDQGQLWVFYRDGQSLRVASGSPWTTAAVDADSSRDVGQFGGAAVTGLRVHAFYFEANFGDLRHATRASTGWQLETLDGDFDAPDGRVAGTVGRSASALVLPGAVIAVYEGQAGAVRLVRLNE